MHTCIYGPADGAHHGYTDGSLENDLPMRQLAELFNVNHFIVSQVNVHAVFLSALSLKSSMGGSLYGAAVGYLRFLKTQCRDWLKNLVDLATYRSNTPWATKRGRMRFIYMHTCIHAYIISIVCT
jgi:TAG lipase/steryl ester hydrolase/phospholipase A2/LPA acyltransferase